MRTAVAFLTLFVLSFASSVSAADLPSRLLALPLAAVPDAGVMNFDIADVRADMLLERAHPNSTDVPVHTIFNVKKHIGIGVGYDAGVIHGSLGYYVTVAELGRWNFGVPAAAIGLGRYRIFDRRNQRPVVRDEYTFIISLASAHYRLGYLRALSSFAYLNVEQVYDMRHNFTGSQFGVSFSRK